MGTVDYMSPEQAMDTKTADARADIYALGCSLNFLLTGKATYEGDTIMKKLVAHREHSIPSLRSARAEVPEQVDAVFKKMIAKKVEDRYQTMTEVITALDNCVRSQEQMVKTQRSLGTSTDSFDLDMKTLFKDVSLEQTEPIRTQKPSRPPIDNGMKKTLLIGGAVLGVMILLAGVIFTFKTKNDTLVATASELDARVQRLIPLEKSAVVETVAGGKPWESPAFQRWMKDVAAMPAEKQVEVVSKKLMELNPAFDGKISSPWDESRPPVVHDGDVVELQIFTDKVADVSPIRALRELRLLHCTFRQRTAQRLDLSPLHGMKIQKLRTVSGTLDLSAVKGLPLSDLACFGSGITNTNLIPISGMPLHTLWLTGNWELTNLEPLKGMPLTFFTCDNTQVADLSPLSGMPLTCLICHVTKVADLSPLKGMPLEELYCDRTLITDLSPLAGMKLKKLCFTPNPELKGLQAIRQMNSLVEIGTGEGKMISSDKFWKQYDEGAFSSPRDFKPVTDVKSPAFQRWMKNKDMHCSPCPSQAFNCCPSLFVSPVQQSTTRRAVPRPAAARLALGRSVLDSTHKSRASYAFRKRTVAPDRPEGHVGRPGAVHVLAAPSHGSGGVDDIVLGRDLGGPVIIEILSGDLALGRDVRFQVP
jgi:outer membrane murein-binding lipoprotein Lpp